MSTSTYRTGDHFYELSLFGSQDDEELANRQKGRGRGRARDSNEAGHGRGQRQRKIETPCIPGLVAEPEPSSQARPEVLIQNNMANGQYRGRGRVLAPPGTLALLAVPGLERSTQAPAPLTSQIQQNYATSHGRGNATVLSPEVLPKKSNIEAPISTPLGFRMVQQVDGGVGRGRGRGWGRGQMSPGQYDASRNLGLIRKSIEDKKSHGLDVKPGMTKVDFLSPGEVAGMILENYMDSVREIVIPRLNSIDDLTIRPKSNIDFTKFSLKMHAFYDMYFNTMPIPDVNTFVKGGYYVVYSTPSKKWRRAILINWKPNGEVLLALVDCGVNLHTLKDNMRYLRKAFSTFPIQARLARIDNSPSSPDLGTMLLQQYKMDLENPRSTFWAKAIYDEWDCATGQPIMGINLSKLVNGKLISYDFEEHI